VKQIANGDLAVSVALIPEELPKIRRQFGKILILLPSPTGFEPVLPP
jgi:hypothetical protein